MSDNTPDNNIKDRQPGDELDNAIGKHLFGLKIVKMPRGYVFYNGRSWQVVPPYSITWNGMQMVVEEMDKRKWDFTLFVHSGKNRAEFGRCISIERATAPHAVCLAALTALAMNGGEQNGPGTD